jgi:hypothetical protein
MPPRTGTRPPASLLESVTCILNIWRTPDRASIRRERMQIASIVF